MEPLTALIARVDAILDSNTYTVEDQDRDIINTKIFEARDRAIKQLEPIVSALVALTSRASALLARANDARTCDMAKAQALTGVDKWTMVARTGKHTRAVARAPIEGKYTLIYVTAALSISAIIVPTLSHVREHGKIYYIEHMDHFAVIIQKQLFHGNIGKIYLDAQTPEKIKGCRFSSECAKKNKCDYYHDPAKFIGSRDRRNFVAGSFVYTSPTAQNLSRRMGSRDTLDLDVIGMSDEDVDRFRDQIMHDLLCFLVLARASVSQS